MEKKNSYATTFFKNEINPDRGLLEWENWIRIRKTETENLGQFLNKQPVDLTMNLLERVREDKERKTALELAKIEIKPTIRGNLWEQPERLHQNCYCEPVYEIHRTKAELGYPQIIEHIGVPDYIQKNEKGVSGVSERKHCKHLDADYVKYRQHREDTMNANIKKIDPFRPDMRELIVKGFKPVGQIPKKLSPLPTITIDPPISHEVTSTVYAVRINNTIIYKDLPHQDLSAILRMREECWHESCTNWNYYFNVPVGRAGRSKLFLKNLGTIALRYCWKKIDKPIPFIPEDFHNQVFFFNKNEDVLSPGQSKEIFYTFISDKPGIYSEFWKLSFCNICFFDTTADNLQVNLYADSIENMEKIKRNTNKLKSRINRKASYYFIRRLVEDAVTKVMTIDPPVYPYKKLFLESEIFLMKNPICFYHQTEVTKMKDIYTDMVPGEIWDLSIAKWRDMMMEKDFDDRMTYYSLLKQSHKDLLKPWHEGENLLTQKCRTMKWLLGQLADKFDSQYEIVMDMYGPERQSPDDFNNAKSSSRNFTLCPFTKQMVCNIFYSRMYDHVVTTMEMIAGVLSGLDLNRWIEFDFCRR